ncbi:MAG TPA: hypothetical protein VHT73_18215 [Thermodesulfobacteriota bacterium]|nr:hypothetical protein [Thermodesulfobacteriota bacterium]
MIFMGEREIMQNEFIKKLAVADSGFTETAIFLAIFMCIFVVGWSIMNLLRDKTAKTKGFEPSAGEVDAKLTWAMVFVGFFMMLCGVYIIFTGFM